MKFSNLSKTAVLFLALALVVIGSCKKEAKTNWDTEMLVPIATTNLSLQNIVKDTSRIKVNGDNSLTLAFNSTLYQLSLADKLIKIPDTSIGQKLTLNQLGLPNQSVKYVTTLGIIAQNMVASSDPVAQVVGSGIIGMDGTTQAIQSITLSPGGFNFDGSGFFDSAYLTSGEVQVWAINKFPVDITTATCVLKNVVDGSIIKTYTIPAPIPAHDSLYFVIPVAGCRITSKIEFSITNLVTAPSNGPVPVKLTDTFELRIFIGFLKASEAWAKFPGQDVVNTTEDITQEIGDRKFTYVDARSGFLHIFITSSVAENLSLDYTLIGAYDANGNPLHKHTFVPAATVNGPETVDEIVDISGFAINLTGKDGTKFNTYTQKIVAHMDSSGITRHITDADSIIVRYEISEVAPNYIKGYAGKDIIAQVDSANFAFLDMFKSGSIDLEDVTMNLSVENGIGVDGQIKINSLSAESPVNGTRNLVSSSVIGQPLTISRATDFPLTPAISNFELNSTNSNIKELLGILPNKIKYDVEVRTNLAGNTQQYRDFAYLESTMKLNLSAEIPLSIIANNLLLKDTFSFDLSNTNLNVTGIKDGVINLIAKNKFPIEAVITMVAYDENWLPVDTITNDAHVEPGDMDANCRVQEFKKSKIPLFVTEDRMDNLKRAKHAVISADFSTVSNNTSCNGQHLKIYSDYNLDITFTAQFNYKVQTHF